ncbi:MAG: 50S ribosomal protein L22 [Candidatus Peregrinibacteria bacterium]
MKASLRSVRIAPKKANLVARMVRAMPVDAAMESLRRTHKKAARLLQGLLASAIANAEQNDKQDRSHLVIKEIIVNKAQSYRRGVPMARGRTRPMRKYLSHIDIILGVAVAEDSEGGKKQETRSKIQEKKPKAGEKNVKGVESVAKESKKRSQNAPKKVSSPLP